MNRILILIIAVILCLTGSEGLEAKKKDRCDLIVRSLSVPSSAYAGTKIKIISSVKNKGTRKAKKSYTEFYLSHDSKLDFFDIYLGRRKVPSLEKKRTSKKYKYYATIPEWVAPGSYYLIAMADGTKRNKENSEKNNYRRRRITIRQTNPAQPTVSSTSPSAEATDVDVSTFITATFSDAMDGSTITTSTFTLRSNQPVSGTVSYNSGTNTATFTPDTDLDYMTAYTVTITTEVTDLAGNTMASNYTWSFTTAEAGGTVTLPETGQTTCYDTSRNVIACSNTGQDGDILAGVAWPSPRFTDNGDGTMTDNLTGLMWLRDANCIATQYPAFDTDGIYGNGAVTWQHALNFVNGINAGTYSDCDAGYTDWRLPNVNELESLVNAEESNNATWLADQGFTNLQLVAFAGLQSNYYWSSTSKANREIEAYHVHMTYGNVGNVNKTLNYYVWPVRAETALPAQLWKTGQTISYAPGDDGDLQKGVAWPSPRFSDNGDGTVTDNLTELMWTRDANTPGPAGCNSGASMQWQESLNYVACLNTNSYLGYSDWRFPNRKELHSLIDFSQVAPSLPSGHPFSNVYVSYSSSTTYAFDSDYEWDVSITSGFHHIGLKVGVGGTGSPVWPVRAGQ